MGVATQGNVRNPCGNKTVLHLNWINGSIWGMTLYYSFAMCYIEESWVKGYLGFLFKKFFLIDYGVTNVFLSPHCPLAMIS